MSAVESPLFRDPVYDGAADPTVIWNRREREWWIFYTNRRAWSPPSDDVGWVHGTDIGIASSADGGGRWTYRGIVRGLDLEPGRHTYWAPELVDDGEVYHMYVSVIRGVPTRWAGHTSVIRHYTSPDLVDWTFIADLDLGSDRVIDACVLRTPGGGYRMWYKDEVRGSHTYCADSVDLHRWEPAGAVLTHAPHEGPNVFELAHRYWMLVDEWRGLAVYRSHDLETWERQGRILDRPGVRPDDAAVGQHADVVVNGDEAHIFYFTHPERGDDPSTVDRDYRSRRSSLQVARAVVVDSRLTCDRDESLTAPILPADGHLTRQYGETS